MGERRLEYKGINMLNVAIFLSVIGTIVAIGLSVFAYKMHNSTNV